jgi:ABC-type lipoprotein export system ATPase subunit
MGIETAQPQPPEVLLACSGLRKIFRMGDEEIHVLREVELAVRQGEFVAIEGRSGSGKSTLLHILGALESCDAGRVIFDGRNYARSDRRGISGVMAIVGRWACPPLFVASAILMLIAWSRPEDTSTYYLWALSLAGIGAAVLLIWAMAWILDFLRSYLLERLSVDLRTRRFGFVFQFFHLLPELNVMENVLLPAMVQRGALSFLVQRGGLREKATEILTQVGLEHRLKHKPSQLSGGERQRVALARALMNSPRVLFADEPTGNLDAETGKQIMHLLEGLHAQGQTIVMVTHDRSIARRADRVVVLVDGRLHAAA